MSEVSELLCTHCVLATLRRLSRMRKWLTGSVSSAWKLAQFTSYGDKSLKAKCFTTAVLLPSSVVRNQRVDVGIYVDAETGGCPARCVQRLSASTTDSNRAGQDREKWLCTTKTRIGDLALLNLHTYLSCGFKTTFTIGQQLAKRTIFNKDVHTYLIATVTSFPTTCHSIFFLLQMLTNSQTMGWRHGQHLHLTTKLRYADEGNWALITTVFIK